MTLAAQQNPNPSLSLDKARLNSNQPTSCPVKGRIKEGFKQSVDNFVILQPFKVWLSSKNYSASTIRNYLSDINAYFEFVSNPLSLRDISLKKGNQQKPPFLREVPKQSEGGRFNSDIFSPDTVGLYLKNLTKDSNYSRYLSSLSKFFQFALDQSLTKTNPLKAALKDKKPSADEIINQYSEYLNKKRFSQATVKNYLNDIRQFIDWSKSAPTSSNQNPPSSEISESTSLKNGGLVNKLKLPFFKGRSPATAGQRGFT